MIKGSVSSTQVDLDVQKKLSWMNVNSAFGIGDKQFYPIGMGSMMNGVSFESQRWMMHDQRLFSASNNAMKRFGEDNISVITKIISESTTSVTFRLFSGARPVVEARSEDESLRMIYDIITGKVTLSCIDTLVGRLKIKEVAPKSSKAEGPTA